MRVVVRWFAILRERRGASEEIVEILPGETIAGLYARLVPPEIRVPVGYARNLAHTGPETPLADGDEVAFLPPLGGG